MNAMKILKFDFNENESTETEEQSRPMVFGIVFHVIGDISSPFEMHRFDVKYDGKQNTNAN